MMKRFAITFHFKICTYRLYWLDGSLIKSSATNGSDIKSHVIAVGATTAFAFKVIDNFKDNEKSIYCSFQTSPYFFL